MPIEDLEVLQEKLRKRGFRIDDPLYHQCADCQEFAVLRYGIAGRPGGRDITICLACGRSRSWRVGVGREGRHEDVDFDLRAFLK